MCYVVAHAGLSRASSSFFRSFFLSFFLTFFFFLFLRRLLSDVTKRILAKPGHIFTYDLLFEKVGPNFPGHLSPRAGGKKTLFGTDFEN